MALDPNAFGPDSGNDNLQPGMRQQRMRALMGGGKASLNSLFSDGQDDTTGAPVPTPTSSPTEPLATPGLGAAEPAGSPSLLSSERVPVTPNFASAAPLLGSEQRAEAAFSEAGRGEEGVLGGGPGRQGLSTADRNRALMSFFRPPQAQQQQTAGSEPPSDAMKALGSAKSAVGALGKAKSLFGGGGGSDRLPVEGNPFGGIRFLDKAPAGSRGTVPTADPEFDPTEGAGSPPGSSFGLPDFTQPGTYGNILGLLGMLGNLAGGASGSRDLATAGSAAGIAGSGVSAGVNAAAGNFGGATAGGLGAVGGLLSLIAQQTQDQQLADAGAATSGAGIAVGALTGGPYAAVAAPAALGALMAPYFKKWDRSHYNMVRNTANTKAGNEVEGLQGLYSQIPQGDLGSTYGALRAQLDPRGAVRSYFQPSAEDAAGLGLTPNDGGYTNWRDMSPQQFNAVMKWIGQDPARLDSVMGSGDVGYLNQGDASGYAGREQSNAKALIARQLGLPYLQTGTGTMPWDVKANAEAEARYQPERSAWYAAHPDVAATPFTPTYGPQQATLQSLFDKAEQQWGPLADLQRSQPAGGG